MTAAHSPVNDTILLAEDNAFVRMQIAKFLTDGGYTVMEAEDGHKALSMLEQHDFGLAMVDVRMEPMNGFEFIRTIRAFDVKIPVVLVTGDSTPDLLEQANKLSVSAVLIKPVQKERLMKTVEKTIQAYRRGA